MVCCFREFPRQFKVLYLIHLVAGRTRERKLNTDVNETDGFKIEQLLPLVVHGMYRKQITYKTDFAEQYYASFRSGGSSFEHKFDIKIHH